MARTRTDTLNVWPAFTDTMLAFVLVLVLMISYQVARSVDLSKPTKVDPGVRQREQDQQRVAQLVNSFQAQGYNIQLNTNGVIQNLSFGSDVTFQSGDAVLSDQGSMLLDKLARAITGHSGNQRLQTLKEIQVAGHTDNVPINNQKFQSNWELSTARATRVVESLIASGVDPSKVTMSATGYGQYTPRASNATLTGRKRNRRIEMRLIYTNKLSQKG
ncbi:OmpA/MotB family protein [Salisaeta longa]|uniref:OmpA/MotB family protein n=1 Tax=Salisaeta longa TaxID=503170 RepID=UPI0003B467D4|nr:OmpA family protein [Salisaeta longa]